MFAETRALQFYLKTKETQWQPPPGFYQKRDNPNKPDTSNMQNTTIDNLPKDWIVLPDPNSGKMYYANLRTKETRWNPPPGFGVSQSSLSPAYNPKVQFQHPNAAVWRTVSNNNLSTHNISHFA